MGKPGSWHHGSDFQSQTGKKQCLNIILRVPLGTLLQTSGEFPDLVHLITLSLSSDWKIAEIVELELSHRFKQDFWSAARVTFS